LETIDFIQRAAKPQAEISAVPFQEWRSPGGSLWARFFRTEAGYLIRFPGLADFEIAADGAAVECWPVDGTSGGTIDHLFLNQVAPLARSRAGHLMFHASAVAIDDFCIAFLGRSGQGKSTLAASLAQNGHPFLTDDSLAVQASGPGWIAQPGHPSVRLWKDSLGALDVQGTALGEPVQFTPKARLLASGTLPYCTAPLPLQAVYVLGADVPDGAVVDSIAGTDALVELMRNSFLLEIGDTESLAAHFERVVALAGSLSFYRVDYPRRYECLEATRSIIIAHARLSCRP
jgi:hypothetical protein